MKAILWKFTRNKHTRNLKTCNISIFMHMYVQTCSDGWCKRIIFIVWSYFTWHFMQSFLFLFILFVCLILEIELNIASCWETIHTNRYAFILFQNVQTTWNKLLKTSHANKISYKTYNHCAIFIHKSHENIQFKYSKIQNDRKWEI